MVLDTAVCRACGAATTEDILDAYDLIYGAPGSGFAERLTDALERATARADSDPLLVADPRREEVAGQRAVLDALGLSSFAALAATFRHYGRYGDCRP